MLSSNSVQSVHVLSSHTSVLQLSSTHTSTCGGQRQTTTSCSSAAGCVHTQPRISSPCELLQAPPPKNARLAQPARMAPARQNGCRAKGVPLPHRERPVRRNDARRMSSTYCVQTGPRRARRHRPHPCAPRRAASPWPEPCRPRAPQPGRGLSPPRAAAQWGPRLQPARPCGGRRAGACGGRRAGARGAGAAGFQRREARGRNELPNVGRARAAAGCHGRRAAVALDVEVKAALLANEKQGVRIGVRLTSRGHAGGRVLTSDLKCALVAWRSNLSHDPAQGVAAQCAVTNIM